MYPVSTELKHLVTLANIGTSFTSRIHEWLFFKRMDDNIFVPASVCYILNELKPLISPNAQGDVEYILRIIKHRYPLYKNSKGRCSYNFWRTNFENSHFPNGNLLNRYKFFRLPDDIDTTAMIMLSGGYDSRDVSDLHAVLPKHANGTRLRIKTTLPEFEQLKCYSTWLGEKMPIEMDCCVISNFLLLVFGSDIPMNEHDRDSVLFLEGVIEREYYFTHPSVVAPQYPRTAIIIYHLARVMAKYPHNFKTDLIKKLKADADWAFSNTHLSFEKMILQTSLLRLGSISHLDKLEVNSSELDDYWWFTAGFLSGYSHPLLKKMAPMPLFHNRFKSSFLNLALQYENEILLDNSTKK